MNKIYLKVLTVFCMFALVLNSELTAQWDTLSTGVNTTLHAVQFINSNTGWIAGSNGKIKKSTNGGTSWFNQSINSSETLRRIFMIDASTGFICGDSGKILKTTNGGNDWDNTNTSGITENIYAMDFINASTGICANESRTQFKTTNGGVNWISSNMNGISPLLSIYGIDMADSNTIYAGTGSGFLTSAKVYKSVNFGTSYTASLNEGSNFSSATIKDVKFINTSTGFAGASNNNLARTTNGGTTWTVKSFPRGNNQISFPDSETGYICGEDFFKAKTDDIGDNWAIDYNYNNGEGLFGISFINSSTGWMCGSGGLLIKTTNGAGIPVSCNITNSSWVNINENTSKGFKSTIDDCGNIYITGCTDYPNRDILTQKYSSSGYLYWSKTYNGSGDNDDIGTQIKLDNDGNVFVAGSATGATTNEDFVLIKYKSDGQREWVRTYDILNHSEYSVELAIDSSGNAIILGNNGYPELIGSVTILKYNTLGDFQWVVNKGNNLNQTARAIVCNNSDDIFIAYTYYVDFNTSYGTIIKLNSSGTEQWTENNINYFIKDLAIGINGNLYVTGSGQNFEDYDFVTKKYNTSGVQLWVRYLDGGLTLYDTPTSMNISNGGQLVITGYTGNMFQTIKYNSNGDLQWHQKYDNPQYDQYRPRDITTNASGDIYITGFCYVNFSNNYDIITMKYNSNGTHLNVCFYNAADFYDEAYSVKTDNSGNVFVTGYTANLTFHSIIIKYDSSDFSDKTLNLKVMIQGFYDSTANAMVSDTATVYLRNSASPYIILDSAKAVLSTSGNGAFTFNNATNGTQYYIVFNHRNSIETWSSNAQSFVSGSLNYDFTNSASTAYGGNLILADASPVRYSVYNADINQDGNVNLSDVILAYNDANTFVTGYKISDVTGNNITDLSDVILAFNNSNMFVTKITP